jgi:hypothetical protein
VGDRVAEGQHAHAGSAIGGYAGRHGRRSLAHRSRSERLCGYRYTPHVK